MLTNEYIKIKLKEFFYKGYTFDELFKKNYFNPNGKYMNNFQYYTFEFKFLIEDHRLLTLKHLFWKSFNEGFLNSIYNSDIEKEISFNNWYHTYSNFITDFTYYNIN